MHCKIGTKSGTRSECARKSVWDSPPLCLELRRRFFATFRPTAPFLPQLQPFRSYLATRKSSSTTQKYVSLSSYFGLYQALDEIQKKV